MTFDTLLYKYCEELLIRDHLVKFCSTCLKEIYTDRFKNTLRHKLKLKWIKRLQTHFQLGFNDKNGKRENGNFKQKTTT